MAVTNEFKIKTVLIRKICCIINENLPQFLNGNTWHWKVVRLLYNE